MASSSAGCLPPLSPICNLLRSKPRSRVGSPLSSPVMGDAPELFNQLSPRLDQMTQIRRSSFSFFFLQGAFIHSFVHSFIARFLQRGARKKAVAFQEIWVPLPTEAMDRRELPGTHPAPLACSLGVLVMGAQVPAEGCCSGRAPGGADEASFGLCPML